MEVVTLEYLHIGVLEKQSSLLRIIVILYKEGEINFMKFIDLYGLYPTPLYSALAKADQLKLIKKRIDKTTYPNRSMLSLTEKGKQIGEHLMAIEEILRADDSVIG